MTQPRLKYFGWGREGEGITPEEEAFVWARIAERFRIDEFDEIKPPRLDEIELHPPRVNPPAALAAITTTERYDRAAHSYGKSYPDYVRGLLGDYAAAPDVVAYPREEGDVAAVLDWADTVQASVTPFGGGSSVVGGVEPRVDGYGRYRAAMTIDLRDMNRVVEVDGTSRAARIEAGAFGPALETELKPHGLTLRHFPQSFEFSTLGGWIAQRNLDGRNASAVSPQVGNQSSRRCTHTVRQFALKFVAHGSRPRTMTK
jgi:alkyldihydroxyacetonephosphate synthase